MAAITIDSASALGIAIGIAAASGFAGAVVGAWLAARHDRREKFRARRLDAAADFVRACADALLQASLAIETLKQRSIEHLEGFVTVEALATEVSAACGQAYKHLAEARAKRALVALLFGVDSPTEALGASVLKLVNDAIDALKPGDDFDLGLAIHHHANASLEMDQLEAKTTRAILRTGSWLDYLSRTRRFWRLSRGLVAGRISKRIDQDLTKPTDGEEKPLQMEG